MEPNLSTTGLLDGGETTAERMYAVGDPEGLAVLWKQHRPWLMRQAAHLSGRNRDVAEEAIGELGAKLARPSIMARYDAGRSWKRWAGKILKNTVWDVLRRNYAPRFRMTLTTLDQLCGDGVPETVVAKLTGLLGRAFWDAWDFRIALAERLPAPELREFQAGILERSRLKQRSGRFIEAAGPADLRFPSPGDAAGRNELKAAVSRSLEELSPRQRAAFIMHFYLGWTFAVIADVLHDERNANLVSRHYYQALARIKASLEKSGFGDLSA